MATINTSQQTWTTPQSRLKTQKQMRFEQQISWSSRVCAIFRLLRFCVHLVGNHEDSTTSGLLPWQWYTPTPSWIPTAFDVCFVRAVKAEEDAAGMEVWLFEEPGGDGERTTYVHHDIPLPSFPLAVTWMRFNPNGVPFSQERPVSLPPLPPTAFHTPVPWCRLLCQSNTSAVRSTFNTAIV